MGAACSTRKQETASRARRKKSLQTPSASAATRGADGRTSTRVRQSQVSCEVEGSTLSTQQVVDNAVPTHDSPEAPSAPVKLAGVTTSRRESSPCEEAPCVESTVGPPVVEHSTPPLLNVVGNPLLPMAESGIAAPSVEAGHDVVPAREPSSVAHSGEPQHYDVRSCDHNASVARPLTLPQMITIRASEGQQAVPQTPHHSSAVTLQNSVSSSLTVVLSNFASVRDCFSSSAGDTSGVVAPSDVSYVGRMTLASSDTVLQSVGGPCDASSSALHVGGLMYAGQMRRSSTSTDRTSPAGSLRDNQRGDTTLNSSGEEPLSTASSNPLVMDVTPIKGATTLTLPSVKVWRGAPAPPQSLPLSATNSYQQFFSIEGLSPFELKMHVQKCRRAGLLDTFDRQPPHPLYFNAVTDLLYAHCVTRTLVLRTAAVAGLLRVPTKQTNAPTPLLPSSQCRLLTTDRNTLRGMLETDALDAALSDIRTVLSIEHLRQSRKWTRDDFAAVEAARHRALELAERLPFVNGELVAYKAAAAQRIAAVLEADRGASMATRHIPDEVLPGMFVSSYHTVLDETLMSSHNIEVVVSCVGDIFSTSGEQLHEQSTRSILDDVDDEVPDDGGALLELTTRNGILFCNIELRDKSTFRIDRAFAAVASVVRLHYFEAGRRVLFVCGVGVSRAPTMCAACICDLFSISPSVALRLIKVVRPQVKPNDAFLLHLLRCYAPR